MSPKLMMVLGLEHQVEPRLRTSWAALPEERSHRHSAEQEERRTFLSHDVGEALRRRKERRGNRR